MLSAFVIVFSRQLYCDGAESHELFDRKIRGRFLTFSRKLETSDLTLTPDFLFSVEYSTVNKTGSFIFL